MALPDPTQPTDQPILPLPTKGWGSLDYWTEQIKGAEEKRDAYKIEWDKNVQSYLAKTLETVPDTDTIVVPKDFANVERKKAELFFQLPEVYLKPKLPGLEDAVLTFQAVLNHKLSADGVDGAGMMAEVLFDALCPSGLMCSKIGYEAFIDGTSQIQMGQQETAPAQPNFGSILGLGATTPAQTQPIMGSAPNVVFERYFWQRISPAKILLPQEFVGSNYDRAPWLGFEFEDDLEVLKQRYKLSDDLDLKGSVGQDEHKLKSERQAVSGRSPTQKLRGWEIWYYASQYDPTVVHPEKMRRLVLLDGLDVPVRHTDSPYQFNDPQTNKLLGMRGFPVHVGALRYVSDTAYPPSECSIGRSQVRELGKSRTQMIQQRDRNLPMRLADVGRLGGIEALRKIERSVVQGIVPLPSFDANNMPIVELQRAAFPPENFVFDKIIDRDLNEIWAFSANQRGDVTDEKKTATEIRNVQANVSARMDYERRLAIRYFVKGVEKLGALVQRFADQQDFVEIVGPDGLRQLQAWDKTHIAGEFVYDAKPDSSVRIDAAQDFRDMIEMYNMLAKDPHVNRVELLTRLTRMKNINPERLIIPQLPEKPPEPPSVGFSFKGEDLNPTNPAFPIVIEIMAQGGYKVDSQAIQQAMAHAQLQSQISTHVASPAGPMQPPDPTGVHGGAAPQADRVSKHQSERSNELSGPSTKI